MKSSTLLSKNKNRKSPLDRCVFEREAFVWLALFGLLPLCSWAVYHVQFVSLPVPLSVEEAGKQGFSEIAAKEYVKNLTSLGPHSVGSDALDLAVQYVLAASEKIKETALPEFDVQVDHFHPKTAAHRLGGNFEGKTFVYSDLHYVVLRILPKSLPEAEESVILVSAHIDTVFSGEGAGDDTSSVGVMLELARGLSQSHQDFKSGVIFLFNTGEEEGLNGAHSFITQHPWRDTIRIAIDLEAMGIGGKSILFQTGSSPWPIEAFAKVAKYPIGQIIAQDLFQSGITNSATDFQVYREVAGLSGLDFAFQDNGAVYHTKNDKLELLKPGSLQHLGENMLAFLLQSTASGDLAVENEEGNTVIFFDVLGMYMVTYRQHFASMLQNFVILLGLLIWTASLLMGGYPAIISFGLSCLSIILMWVFSLSLSALVAFVLPHLGAFAIPYIVNPWLVIGLFGAPAILGALTGQHIGFMFLQQYLQQIFPRRVIKLPPNDQANLAKWEAERWIFKAGFVPWFVLLVVGNYFKIGSSYLALIWFGSPALAYCFMEATLSPAQEPRPLKVTTLIVGLVIPFILSAGVVIQLIGVAIGNMVRLDRNPGSSPEWLGNLIIAIFVAAVVCLTLTFLLSYAHLSGPQISVILPICALFGLALIAVSSGIVPAFTEDISRAVSVVEVVETTGGQSENQNLFSFVSLFSGTPGKLKEEMKSLEDEGFACGRDETLDFVNFNVKYGCLSTKVSTNSWNESEIPVLHVERDSMTNIRKTRVLVDTKISTRWALAINAEEISGWELSIKTEEISNFTFNVDSEEAGPVGNMSTIDGWHIIQFAGGKDSPTKFHLKLFWQYNGTHPSGKSHEQANRPLLKLRTDVNRITPTTARVLKKLPSWCSLFGKSSSPYTLAFLTDLPVHL